MKNKILVAYASKYGSTQEVAEAIVATLREEGFKVDIQPMKKVRSLEEYTMIVLGAPLYMGAWHKDARRFLSRHREALMERQISIFALGPFHAPYDEKEWQASQGMLEKDLAEFPGLAPVAVEIFGGKFEPAKLGFTDKLIVSMPASPLHKMPASDLRDWTAIRAWANKLAAQLQPDR